MNKEIQSVHSWIPKIKDDRMGEKLITEEQVMESPD